MYRHLLLPVAVVGLASSVSIPLNAWAQSNVERAHIAIVGDADRFNIGQEGYCGKRTEIENPSSVSFQVPAGKETWFYIRTRLHLPSVTTTCEGDFSFVPEPGHLHIVRFTFAADACLLEMFRTKPGGTPRPAPVKREAPRSCLTQ